MLIIAYCLGIRSERRLCEEVKPNLAYRWFCRLSVEDEVWHRSTISKNRHGRFPEAEAFRCVIEQVLKSCIDAGLVGSEGFAVDASVVKADAGRQRHHDDDDDWVDSRGNRQWSVSQRHTYPDRGYRCWRSARFVAYLSSISTWGMTESTASR